MANDRARFLAAVGMRPPRRAPCTFVRLNEVVLPSPVPPGQLSPSARSACVSSFSPSSTDSSASMFFR